ncbi:bacteriophage spanin2 family protein [Epilithonimonas sp. UC225_85]|uniref:bacteriophage spanin2 family protein n=1 Tax=Epilithonimonas sp. UC225_85 TaxID=3350167 RepID=UPI0036D334BD
MKVSKKLFWVLSVFIVLVSCQTRVVSPNKPFYDNSIELYKKYTIQTKDAKKQKIEILKIDATKIYGKNQAGDKVEIEKSEIREIRKPNLLTSILLAVFAVGGVIAVIFVPV